MRSPLLRKLAASLVLATLAAPAAFAADSFKDVAGDDDYSEAIASLKSKGVLEGYADGTFRPASSINRAEFLKIVLEARSDADIGWPEDCFPDVKDQWYARYVCTAKDEGIIGGYPDGTFKPERNINFVEASKIVALAYGQEPQTTGGEWYRGYVEALEASGAIPLSIAAFDEQLNRGEMAEIMWRLDEGLTDRPAKGYMNVKYPTATVDFSSDKAQTATSCADLRALAEEANADSGMRYLEDKGVMAPAMPGSFGRDVAQEGTVTSRAQNQAGGGSDEDFSRTNTQVEGVDEADIIKTNGTHLFVVRQNEVKIIVAKPANDMEVVSTIKLGGDQFTPQELYIDGDKLVIIGSSWTPWDGPSPLLRRPAMDMMIWPGYNRSQTDVYIFDVSDPADPEELRQLSFDGSRISSRRIDDRLYLVMNQGFGWNRPMPLAETKDAELLPLFSDSALDIEDQPVSRCGDVTILPRTQYPQYLLTAVVPLDSVRTPVSVETVVGNGENVYMSLDNLFIAETKWDYTWDAQNSTSQESTNVYRFAITDDGLEFGTQGSVPGRILNQFSMDEHEEMFRIATTESQIWRSEQNVTPSTNNLYILNQDMKTVGSVEDIAPGEQIHSVRFMGDRAYMVTFRNIDPFFVIDVSDPRHPEILGQLKIPGYSDYLHPYDETHIIGIGKDAVASKDPDFAWYQGMKLALFDVSDVSDPEEMHKIIIGDRGTDSPLLYDHKALLFDKERDLLAFPIRIAEIPAAQKTGNDGSAYGQSVFQGAQVYTLTLKDGFKLRGQVTHYTDDDKIKAGEYFYGKDIERIVRLGESLLTVSQAGVQSHTASTVKQEGSLLYQPDRTAEGECPGTDEGATYISTDPDTCATIRYMCAEGKEPFSGTCGCGCK